MQNHITSTTHQNTIPFVAPDGRAPAPETDAVAAPEAAATPAGRKRGRQSIYSEKVVQMICAAIRQLGLSDSAAAKHVGMSSSSLSRWKHDHPELRPRLEAAREDCRRRHLERIERFADRDDAIGFRASIWLAERVFPGDYAKTQRERWAVETAEEQREEKEQRELGNVLWAEHVADEAAEKARKAAEAEALKQTAATESDSQNVKNSDAAVSPGEVEAASEGLVRPRAAVGSDAGFIDSGRGRPGSLTEAARPEGSAVYSEDDSQNVKNSGRPDAGPLMEAVFGPCVTDSRNVKKSPPSPMPAARATSETAFY